MTEALRYSRRALVVTALVCAAISAPATAPAYAEECVTGSGYGNCGPGWALSARTFPTNIAPEGKGMIDISVFNTGAGGSHGPITITDRLPAGVTAREVEFEGETQLGAGGLIGKREGVQPHLSNALWQCVGNGAAPAPQITGATEITCTNTEGLATFEGGGGGPNFSEGPYPQPEIGIAITAPGINPGAGGAELANQIAIGGGGAARPGTTSDVIKVSEAPPPFELLGWDGWLTNSDGSTDTQAGSHPYQATFSFDLPVELKSNQLFPSGGEPRTIEVALPPGFLGDPTAAAQCTREQLIAERCPDASQVGIDTTSFNNIGLARQRVWNVVPPPGVPAEFAVNIGGIKAFLDSTVRTGGDAGITTTATNVPQRLLAGNVLTLWGVPGDPTHDPWRTANAGGCSREASVEDKRLRRCGTSGLNPVLKPFLTLPTSCGAPQPFGVRVSSWQHPGAWTSTSFTTHDSTGDTTPFAGCEQLAFGPSLSTAFESTLADSGTGLTADVEPQLGGLSVSSGLSSSAVKRATVTLPEGFVVNPGQAAGLRACQETPEQSAIGTQNPPSCPAASKIGTAKIKSPLLETAAEKELVGNVYVLQSNPPELHLLVAASADGINFKLVGVVHLNEATGRLTTTFGEDPAVEASDPSLAGHMALPQLPFSDFKLTFEGGAKAALVTPSQCGTFTTNANFTPWSSPFISDFSTTAAFGITSGVGGGACPSGPLPFSPSLAAGSTNTEAGAFTGFTQLLSRADGQQRIEKFQFKEPAGMAGMLSQVPLCPEAQANAGSCGEASKIGHAIVAAGPGANPLTLPQPGGPEIPIYLTGPYHGAPFGLSISTPIVAGPFNLGTIVTRAKIEVDPSTAQITITTDPLPQIVDGVPTDLRSIYAVIDRSGFLFNPTNCTPQEFVGTATSAGGAATAPISSHFGIGACKGLKFSPKFSLATAGKTSKAAGASLITKLTYPKEPQGSQANIAYVKVELPKQLPSRLTTLQKACTAAQFEANPAGCPAASIVGHAVVHTPVLPVPLTGPAYFVSHGNEAFPSLTIVLQGYGVTIDLIGTTLIRKGVTSTTFKSVPDVPFETFELALPQGANSALAANGNLCTSKLQMSIEYHAQNGALLTAQTPIAVQGCPSSISIASHKVNGRNVTLRVSVPAAGKLTASGKGLSRASKKATGRETLTLKLHTRKGGKLKTKVRLSFAPAKGAKLAKSLGVRFR
jgi:hypothetical protein